MKRLLLSVLIFLSMLGNAVASNSVAECNLLESKNSQYFCSARKTGEQFYCLAITNQDIKNLCISIINGNTTNCMLISDKELQKMCMAGVF